MLPYKFRYFNLPILDKVTQKFKPVDVDDFRIEPVIGSNRRMVKNNIHKFQ
jgi:hypothetical protein